MRRVYNIFTLVLFLTAAILTSCQRRELDMLYTDKAELTIILDWSKADLRPDGATILFYPEDGSAPIEKLTHSDTTTITLNVGFYSIIAFNETSVDFDYIAFRNTERFETIEAYVKPEGTNKADDVISANPDILASASISQFEVTQDMVEETRTRTKNQTKSKSFSPTLTYTLQPQRVVYPAQVTAHVIGMDRIASAGAYVRGFTESVFLGTNRTSIYSTTQKFSFSERVFNEGSYSEGYLRGNFTCFGLRQEQDNAEISGYSLDFKSVLIDGNGYDRTFVIDKNLIVVNIEIGIEILIEVGLGEEGDDNGPIIIPEVEGAGGWEIDVGEWEDIIIPIEL